MEIWNYLWHFIFCLFLWQAGDTTQKTTSNGSYKSWSKVPSSAAASDSPSPGGSSPVPSSSTPSSSQGSTEAELTMTAQPSMAVTPSGPASSAGLLDSGTALTATAPMQGQATAQMGSTSASTGSPLSSTAPASASSLATTRHSTGATPTTTRLSGTTDELYEQTSSFFPATSLAAASMTTSHSAEASTEKEPMIPSGTASTAAVSGSSQATSDAATTVRPDTSATGVATASGSAGSVSPTRSSAAASDSPSPGGSSPVPSSSTPSSSQGSTEAELTMTAQPSMAVTPSGPASSAGLLDSGTALTATAPMQGQATAQMGSTSASTGSPLSSTAPASASSLATTRHSTGATPTTTGLIGTVIDSQHVTSSFLLTTSLAAASVATVVDGEGWTENEPTMLSGTLSSPELTDSSQATISSFSTVRPVTGFSSVTTASGSAGSVSPVSSLLSSFFTTSLEHVSPSNFSSSSSYIPPSPGFCSPVTLSIQLENVTSRTIQFSWKPQGGTRDSPYHVRLWAGPREMENRSLNETSTAFESLLSDHEYQVSVDVLTCSKNVSTSMTVRTVAKVFNGTTRITNKDFIPEYLNKSSTEFKKFEAKFIEEIKKHLPAVILKLIEEGKMRIVINSLTNGSVIASFSIVLDGGENVTKTEISDAFTEALNMSTVLKADLKKTIIEARNSCQPGLNDCSQNATCSAEGATYSCQCNERFTDNSPRVPGRVCQLKQNPPSQHITTVPPESAMGRSTGTTTSSPFATTFTSGACMPVFIKVENVSAEAIRLSWTSEDGKRGSLYTVFLMDGIQEINKTTTNETTITFKDLLPGHVYTISVEVLSCTENSRSSVRVRTDPVSCFNRTDFCLSQNRGCPDLKYIICSNYQSFACRALLKKQIFNDSLYDTDSGGYKAISESIKTEIVTEMRIKLKDDHFDIMVLGFRPGSVIVYFISVLQKQEPVDVKVVQEYLSQILKSKFGDQTEVQVQSLSTQSSTGKSSSWKVAVIVLGVLLGVALVLIFLLILVYIWRKKSSGKYLVEPTGLLGNFVYKHL